MNLTPDEILSQARSEADALDPLAALTLATQLQLAAAVLFVRAFDAASATTEASPPKPESDRLISIRDGARRINKHRNWLDRHGRTLGIVVCDPASGRALGCSEHAINRFLAGKGARNG